MPNNPEWEFTGSNCALKRTRTCHVAYAIESMVASYDAQVRFGLVFYGQQPLYLASGRQPPTGTSVPTCLPGVLNVGLETDGSETICNDPAGCAITPDWIVPVTGTSETLVAPDGVSKIDYFLSHTLPQSDTPGAATLANIRGTVAEIKNNERRQFIILLTDGDDSCSGDIQTGRDLQLEQVELLWDEGIQTFVIGFGDDVDVNYMDLLGAAGAGQSSCPAGNCYYQANLSSELLTAFDNII